MADVQVTDEGTIVLLTARTPEGKAWIEEYLDVPEYMRLPGRASVACEHRMVGPILDGMTEAGLSLGTL
jgi:hypothetical protein